MVMFSRSLPSSLTAATPVLFGESRRKNRMRYENIGEAHIRNDHSNEKEQELDDLTFDTDILEFTRSYSSSSSSSKPKRDKSKRPQKGSIADFFFGFMYEDDIEDDEDDEILYYSSIVEETASFWKNSLNLMLFSSLTLQAAATSVPVAIISQIGNDLMTRQTTNENNFEQSDVYGDPSFLQTEDSLSAAASFFASRAAAAAVLGTSIGKLLNGPAVDVVGARRTSVLYSIMLSTSLILLGLSNSIDVAIYACFLVEFANSVQWPCVVVTLASHARGDTTGMYEGGIFVTSLGARLGSLIGIPLSSLLMKQTHWRFVALLGAWAALVASSITYLFVTDSPNHKNDPQNPIDPKLILLWKQQLSTPEPLHSEEQQIDRLELPRLRSSIQSPSLPRRRPIRRQIAQTSYFLCRAFFSVLKTNIFPSLRHILFSGVFWIIAFAHTGASMVRTSERILGTYFYATSSGSLTQSRAAGLAVFLSIGIVGGLLVAGNAFATKQERERKWMVSRLYLLSIMSVYMLAFLAVPSIRSIVPAELITSLQVISVSTAGFGISVQLYHIPSLVGATFGCDKGLFSAYMDGVACGLASLMWRIVGGAVQQSSDAVNGGGWAYGWAAVALLLILSAVLMVEFMEHYLCRPRHGGNYETIIFA